MWISKKKLLEIKREEYSRASNNYDELQQWEDIEKLKQQIKKLKKQLRKLQ